jgi:hypothetical protein
MESFIKIYWCPSMMRGVAIFEQPEKKSSNHRKDRSVAFRLPFLKADSLMTRKRKEIAVREQGSDRSGD